MAFIRKMTAQHSLTISESYTADSESPEEEKKSKKESTLKTTQHSNGPDTAMIMEDGICRHLHQGAYHLIIYLWE